MAKAYKYMTSISKNVYIDKLDDIVNEYNNTYHRTIKMKSVDLKSNKFIDFGINKGQCTSGPTTTTVQSSKQLIKKF